MHVCCEWGPRRSRSIVALIVCSGQWRCGEGSSKMRVVARSLGVALLAVLGAVAISVSWTLTTAVQLLATTALVMSGTFVPDPPPDYVDGAVMSTSSPRWVHPTTWLLSILPSSSGRFSAR